MMWFNLAGHVLVIVAAFVLGYFVTMIIDEYIQNDAFRQKIKKERQKELEAMRRYILAIKMATLNVDLFTIEVRKQRKSLMKKKKEKVVKK